MEKQEHPLRRLMQYARGYRARVNLATFYSFANKLFDLAPPVLIGMAVDVVVSQENSFLADFGITDVRSQLIFLGLLTLIIWGLESWFEYLMSVAWRNLAQDLQHDLRVETYGHVQGLEIGYFEERSTGKLMSVLNDDINQLER
ncbi:MAG: ABC transporter transmembrane domain-containing protein, partial [Anaerolineales bacterium]|nr:ABC transporter transmembrane domain-containing protein [Anaerolineales bacterium]